MPNLLLLVLIGGLFVVLLIPARRLQQGGWPPRVVAIYLGSMILFGLLLAELRVPARFLVPIFIVAYVAPFVTVRTGLERIGLRNPREASDIRVERPPTKQVSGPSRDVDTGPAEEGGPAPSRPFLRQSARPSLRRGPNVPRQVTFASAQRSRGRPSSATGGRRPVTRALVVQHDRAVMQEELGSLRALGCEVVLCGGPDKGTCPVFAGRPCPLAEHADVLVYDVRSLRYGDDTHELIDELRALYADKPLLVVGDRSDDLLDPGDGSSLIWLRGGASVGRMDLAIEEALSDR